MELKIVCLIRGGEAGRAVQERAIELASMETRSLVFVHIIDLQALGIEVEAIIKPACEELTWIGRVLLNLALVRAKTNGVQAEGVLRFGFFREEVYNFLKETPASRLLLGETNPQIQDYEFRRKSFQEFALLIEGELNVSVEIVPAFDGNQSL